MNFFKTCFACTLKGHAVLIVSAIALGAMCAHAQNVPTVSKGNLELGLFGGESYGLDRFRPMGGANIAYGLNRRLYPFFEGSYLPGVLRKIPISGTGSSTKQFSTDLTDFHGGIHFRFVRGETKVIPYAVLGTGVIHASESTLITNFVFSSGTQSVQSKIPSKTSWEVNFGGGLRFFFKEKFGIRLEMKAFRPTTAPAGVDNGFVYRFAIGPYFQIR